MNGLFLSVSIYCNTETAVISSEDYETLITIILLCVNTILNETMYPLGGDEGEFGSLKAMCVCLE